jgi:NAD(P)-dependent dehydrogenase (short-subunit alcohol dehydrogenase family)
MTTGSGRFGGKVVVVTGAGSGIGAAAADRFVAEGARVVYADRDAGRLSQVATSAEVLAVPADVADPASVSDLVSATLDRFGGVDVVVSRASGGAARSLTSPTTNGTRSSASISGEPSWSAAGSPGRWRPREPADRSS